MEIETDAQRMANAPGLAFEWVAQEMEWVTDASRQLVRRVFFENENDPNRLFRELRKTWPADLRWPSGESFLHSQGWRPKQKRSTDYVCRTPDLPELLGCRLMHVSHRLYRDPQVKNITASWPAITHLVINRGLGDLRPEDHCGMGFDREVPVAEGLQLLDRPACPHPACCCTIDPVLPHSRGG